MCPSKQNPCRRGLTFKRQKAKRRWHRRYDGKPTMLRRWYLYTVYITTSQLLSHNEKRYSYQMITNRINYWYNNWFTETDFVLKGTIKKKIESIQNSCIFWLGLIKIHIYNFLFGTLLVINRVIINIKWSLWLECYINIAWIDHH